MKRTLLEGNIRSELVALSLPLLIGNVLQQLYNTVDSLIIGRYMGTEAFSAVGIAGSMMNLFIFVLSGFCTGISIIFAQMYGGGDRKGFRREVFISASLGAGITLALSLIFALLMRPILRLINSPEELIPYIESYLQVIVGGMLCTYFYNLCSNILSAIGDTRAATFFLFIAVMVNAVLDILFVKTFSMGIAGAAWATVISQLLSALCCLIYLFRRDRDLICTRYDMNYERGLVKRTLSFGFISALQQSSLYIGKIAVQGAVNLLGTSGIAAYTATMRVEGFANSFGTSMGQAQGVFISQNHGAGKYDRECEGLRKGIQLALFMGVTLSALMFVVARPGVRLFLGESETLSINLGVNYLRLMALFYTLCFTGNTFAGFFRGVGRMQVPLIGTTLHIIVRAALSYLLVNRMGLRAVALATGIGWTLLFLYQIYNMLRYRRQG